MIHFFKTQNALYVGLVLALVSCGDDDAPDVIPPAPVNEEELITTMRIDLIPEGGSATKVLLFRDLDGEGGNPPVITTNELDSDTIYTGTVTLLNEQATPPEDITEEVRAEGMQHQFFYEYSSTDGSALDFTYDDGDAIGDPIGIKTVVTSSAAGSGMLKVTLRHDLNKGAPAVGNGDIRNAGGETDIEVDFPVTIQ